MNDLTSIARLIGILTSLFFVSQVAVAQTGFSDARNRDGIGSGFGSQAFNWGFGGANDTRFAPSPAAPTYRLGVFVEHTDRGEVVTQVQPGSPASRSGIDQGDVIFNVAGYQVGYVDGRLYDVGDEVGRRVSPNGQVNLLVQDRRSGQVESVSVSMQSSSSILQGEVSYRDRIAIPPGSRLTVKLSNASRAFADIAGGIYEAPLSMGPPFSFEMHIDPQYLYSGDRYQIQAFITSNNNQVLFQSLQPQPIDPTRNNGPIRLEVSSVSGGLPANQNSYAAGYSSVDAIRNYYSQFLQRPPLQNELQAWQQHAMSGRSLDDLPVLLMSSPEFWERSGGNPSSFIDRAFRAAAGRQARQDELNTWSNLLQQSGGNRTAVVRQFYSAISRR